LNQLSDNRNTLENDLIGLNYAYEGHNNINNATNDNIIEHEELKELYHSLLNIVTSNININIIEDQIKEIGNNNLKLKSQNESIHQSNSILQNKISILSDKISYIRGILQNNKVI